MEKQIQIPADTIYKEKIVGVPQSNPNKRKDSFKDEERPLSSKTEIKTGDTSIVLENQPSNINYGDNSVVGNNVNSTITVNPKEKLSKEEKTNLVKELNLAFSRANRSSKSCLRIFPINNHPKAIEVIEDLEPFSVEQGYTVLERNIGFYARQPISDNKITFEIPEDDDCVRILVSFKN